MRVRLAGDGEPIPKLALPDPNLDDAAVPVLLELEDGDIFRKADYVALGYTHFEVWCIGAVGGKGADGGGRGYLIDPNTGYTASDTYPGQQAMLALSWPYYFVDGVTHVHDPQIGGATIFGGAGGGGGLHRVGGALADIPDEVPVTVGVAGENKGVMQASRPDPIVPMIATTYDEAVGDIGKKGWPFFPGGVFDLPHTPFDPMEDGGDGGHSAFGDICQASGGEGGKAAGYWVGAGAGALLWIDGKGGAGGTGGRTEPGGGAAGGSSEADAPEGTWDGTIGKGGGGGRGGTVPYIPPPIQYSV